MMNLKRADKHDTRNMTVGSRKVAIWTLRRARRAEDKRSIIVALDEEASTVGQPLCDCCEY